MQHDLISVQLSHSDVMCKWHWSM